MENLILPHSRLLTTCEVLFLLYCYCFLVVLYTIHSFLFHLLFLIVVWWFSVQVPFDYFPLFLCVIALLAGFTHSQVFMMVTAVILLPGLGLP